MMVMFLLLYIYLLIVLENDNEIGVANGRLIFESILFDSSIVAAAMRFGFGHALTSLH